MRVPHTIPINTHNVYLPSEDTLNLGGEVARSLKPENERWDLNIPLPLVTLAVQAIALNFKNVQIFSELTDINQDLLLENLPTDLPENLTIPLIPDGIYWQRSSLDRWASMNDVRDYGNSWKRLYLERHLQHYLETVPFEDFVPTEVEPLLDMCSPYICRLVITQLQVPNKRKAEEGGDECVDPVINEHINLGLVIQRLNLLEEFHVIFGVRNCGMDFEWGLFEFSKEDCKNIASCLSGAKNLRIFKIHRSTLDDIKAVILLQALDANSNLQVLDLSHCNIRNSGALAIGSILTVHQRLKVVNLCNNKIGPKGVKGLAYALTQSTAPLQTLNLRLNVIRDAGASYLASALRKGTSLLELILAACEIKEDGAMRLGLMLPKNTILQSLDLGSNDLGEVAGRALQMGLAKNVSLLHLDVRMTNISADSEGTIKLSLHSNMEKRKSKIKSYERAKKLIDMQNEEADRLESKPKNKCEMMEDP